MENAEGGLWLIGQQWRSAAAFSTAIEAAAAAADTSLVGLASKVVLHGGPDAPST